MFTRLAAALSATALTGFLSLPAAAQTESPEDLIKERGTVVAQRAPATPQRPISAAAVGE
jgi:hypothetical protein